MLGNERENVYYNIKKESFILHDDNMPKVVFPENSPVDNIKKSNWKTTRRTACDT